MARMPEQGRLAAHAVLDAVTAHDGQAPDAINAEAMNLALVRLNEVGAVTATYDDEADSVAVDVGHLVGGVAVAIRRLVRELERVLPSEPETIIAELREFLDGHTS